MKILGIGNAIVDVICKVEDDFITKNNLTKSTMKLIFDDKEFKDLLSNLKIEKTVSGGSVANSIVGLSQLGNEVGFIGKVNDDELGGKYEDGLKQENVKYFYSKKKEELPTGTCLILVTPDSERTMCTYLGTAGSINENDVDTKVIQNSEITLAESSAICEYLNEKFPDPELLPNNIEERAEVRRLVSWFDDKFNREVTQKLVYERITKKIIGEGFPEAKNVKRGMHNIKFHIDYMSKLLEGRKWLAGNDMSLADFAAAAHISVLDYSCDVDWHRSHLVKDWYAKIKSRPAFRSLLADHLPGFPQPNHYADLDF